LEHRRKLREAPPAETDPRPVYDRKATAGAWALEREAEELQREDMWAQREPTPPPAKRRSIPYTAPVSRDVPSVSTGRPASLGNTVTLSPAEREIARKSFTDPSMSDEAKERSYAMQKLRMLCLRADGTLNE
jgi:hypothetical protein